MAKPVILTVDDEPQVLNAIECDLRQRFSTEYRILKSKSGKEALQTVRDLKKRNTPVALLLVDQRMPEMSGTDFLVEAAKFYPEAKKALLTAYSDTQAGRSPMLWRSRRKYLLNSTRLVETVDVLLKYLEVSEYGKTPA